MIDRFYPGRWATLRPATLQEIKATRVIGITIEQASAKVRAKGIGDDEDDYVLPIYAERIPVKTVLGAPEPCPRLLPGVERPEALAGYRKGRALGDVLTDAHAATFPHVTHEPRSGRHPPGHIRKSRAGEGQPRRACRARRILDRGRSQGKPVSAGWADLGFPGLVLDPDGDGVEVFLFSSPDLPEHWSRLDAFEGSGCRRVVAESETADGVLDAYIYVLAEAP